jgi:putative oxidoreductase
MRHLLYPGAHAAPTDVGLLVFRLVMGAAFILHGWPKIQNPFGWMPTEANMPGILQFLAALSEFGGGIGLILGLLTRFWSLGLAVTMAVAAGMVHIAKGDPFVASGPGQPSWELAAVYFAGSVLFLLAGPGRWSVDACLFGRAPRLVESVAR